MKPVPVAIVAVILIFILSIPIPSHQGLFLLDLLNAGHAPLFGVASLVLLRLAPRERKGTLREYLGVLILTVLLGIVTELVQSFEGGDAEPRDAVVDFLGAASFLMVHWTMQHGQSGWFRRLLRITALAALTAVFWPPILSGMSTLRRNRAFPVIMNFDSTWESRRCRSDDATFEITSAPLGAQRSGGDKMGRITFRPLERSFFLINDIYPNWTGYQQLGFTAYSELTDPLNLTVTLHDRNRHSRKSSGYDTVITINPGKNHIRISLSDMGRGSAPRRMDINSMYQIIFSPTHTHPKDRFSVYLDDVHLE
jgi:hypothetical protein